MIKLSFIRLLPLLGLAATLGTSGVAGYKIYAATQNTQVQVPELTSTDKPQTENEKAAAVEQNEDVETSRDDGSDATLPPPSVQSVSVAPTTAKLTPFPTAAAKNISGDDDDGDDESDESEHKFNDSDDDFLKLSTATQKNDTAKPRQKSEHDDETDAAESIEDATH